MIIELLITYIVSLISFLGYPGLFILMMFESMILPVPSELVMPFAGFLVNQGRFSFLGVALISSLGSIVGSLISYYIGLYGGERFIRKFGKYFLLDLSHLKWTENWFKHKGDLTILISRFIPVVRHLISIPAGIGKMNLKKFILYTFIGAFIWNNFLSYLGILLNEKWEVVHTYSGQIDIIAIVIIILLVIYFVYKRLKK